MTEPKALTGADLLTWAIILEYRAQQQRDGLTILLQPYPPCPVCGGSIHGHDSITVERGIQREATVTLRPCQHQFTCDDDAIDAVWTHFTAMIGDLADADHGRPRPGWLPEHWTTSDVIREAKKRLAAGDGPSVRDCAADDRRWPLQKHGE